MKSTIMGLWLLTVTLGNVFVSLISLTRLPPASSFWLFAAVGGAGALLFGRPRPLLHAARLRAGVADRADTRPSRFLQ